MTFTFAATLRAHARTIGNTVAVTDTETTWTWRDLDDRTHQVARALRRAGVRAGDRVAYLGRNRIEFFELVYGVAKAGAVCVPLNWRLTADESRLLIEDSGAVLVLAEPQFVAAVPDGTAVVTTGADYLAFVGRETTADPGLPDPHPDTVVLQSYTSGTTSTPKGALFTYRNLEHSMECGRAMGIGPGCVILAVLPVHHVGGSVFALYPTYFGGTLIVPGAFEPARAVALIERYRVTNLTMVPTVAVMLAELLERTGRNLSSLVSVVYGGAPMAPRELERVQRALAAPLVNVYGMTECPAISYLTADDHTPELVRRASIGRPFLGNEVSVRDPDTGRELADEEAGELCIRAAGCTAGYWRNEERTAQLRTTDGWMRTGDIARRDAAGYLFLVDRATDLIITGGENVYPAEVERVLARHEDVDQVAVIGVPDARWGEVIAAFVVRRPGSGLTGEQLVDWSRSLLPGFRRPRRVTLVPELPRTASGKISRRTLREGSTDRTVEKEKTCR
jgi:long-chain acyl-CoA synthetase